MTDTAYGETAAVTFTPALRRLCAVVILGAFMTVLDTTIVNVAIDTLGRDFEVPVATIQWVATGYLLALSLVIPLTGWAVERFGARNLWFGALGLFIAGSLLSGLAWSAGSLIAFRVLQGAAGGVIMPVGQAMVARAAGPQRMGRVMGVIAVPALLAPVLGPVIGGAIVDGLSWRWIFYVNVPVGAAALAAAWLWLKPDEDRNPAAPVDRVGIALLSPGLAAFVYGISQAGATGVGSAQAVAGMLVGAALVAAFVVHALRTPHPLIDVRLFGDRTFSAAGATMFIFIGTLFAAMFLFPLYEQALRAQTALDAGLLLAPQGLAAMVTMPFGGKLADAVGARVLVLAGVAFATLGNLMLTTVGPDSSQALLALSGVPRGIGMGLAFPALMGAAYRTLSVAAIPRASTAINIVQRVGGAIGTAAFAVILQHGLDAGRGTDAFATAFWWVTVVGALAAVPAALLALRPAPSGAAPAPIGPPAHESAR